MNFIEFIYIYIFEMFVLYDIWLQASGFRITIFGESAGAMSVHALHISPKAEGKVVGQSWLVQQKKERRISHSTE